jgi:ATP-binding cassette subfamily B protein
LVLVGFGQLSSGIAASLIQVLAASFVVQLFTLANPLLIQVIIDKVISQRSLDTLQVLGFALVVVTILEGISTVLKTFLFAETTNRIDHEAWL